MDSAVAAVKLPSANVAAISRSGFVDNTSLVANVVLASCSSGVCTNITPASFLFQCLLARTHNMVRGIMPLVGCNGKSSRELSTFYFTLGRGAMYDS
mmetsp:Transcript_10847/g.23209  ORF Transcript_10847/g.23209 Transcript_10847/m.23209 type:complete len:97 (+) Transcript_10847:424-714(+)